MISSGRQDRTVPPSAPSGSALSGSSLAQDVTEPLPAIGAADRTLPGQIARFGNLAGRDLSARAFATLRASGSYDPRRHGDTRDCQPLSRGEQLEMLALRTAIAAGYQAAVPAGSGPAQTITRPIRLRRPLPPPGPHRPAARHRRIAV